MNNILSLNKTVHLICFFLSLKYFRYIQYQNTLWHAANCLDNIARRQLTRDPGTRPANSTFWHSASWFDILACGQLTRHFGSRSTDLTFWHSANWLDIIARGQLTRHHSTRPASAFRLITVMLSIFNEQYCVFKPKLSIFNEICL